MVLPSFLNCSTPKKGLRHHVFILETFDTIFIIAVSGGYGLVDYKDASGFAT